MSITQHIAAGCLIILLVWFGCYYVAPWVLLRLWRWINKPGKKKILCLSVSAFVCVHLRLQAGIEFTAITHNTNRPSFPFSAAGGSTAYFDGTNRCHSVTLTIAGDPGVYDLLWDYDLDQSSGLATNAAGGLVVEHPFITVSPPVTNLTGTVTVTYPARTNSPAGFYRLQPRNP